MAFAESALVSKTVISFLSNDDVVQYRNPYDFTNFHKPSGQTDILLTGGGIPAGVVVYQNNGGSRMPDCRVEDFTWVDD